MKAKTAPKRQGPALRSGPGESATFQLPTPDAWAVLVRGLQLTPQQKHDLDLALRHVDADLKTFRAKFAGRKPRPELVRRLKRMATIMWHPAKTRVRDLRLRGTSDAFPLQAPA